MSPTRFGLVYQDYETCALTNYAMETWVVNIIPF